MRSSLLSRCTVLLCNFAACAMATQGRPIYIDGVTPLFVPRVRVSGPAVETLYRLRVAPHGIVVNASHVFIPFGRRLDLTFLSKSHTHNSEERGHAVWYFSPNAPGRFDNFVSIAEKTHLFSHTGPWSTTGSDRVKSELIKRNATQNRVARDMRNERNRLVAKYELLNCLACQLSTVSVDLNHLKLCASYAANSSGNQGVLDKMKNLSALRSMLLAAETRKDPSAPVLASGTNCYHWTRNPSIAMVKTNEGFYVSLRRNMVTYHGKAQSAPSRLLRFEVGVSFLNYEPSDDMLEIYESASSQSYLNLDDNYLRFFIGPADSDSWTILAEDGRFQYGVYFSPGFHPSPSIAELYNKMQQIPIDYAWADEDVDRLCPIVLRNKLESQRQSWDLLPYSYPKRVATMADADVDEVVNFLGDSAWCGTSWWRSSAGYRVGYDLVSSLTWNHFQIEVPAPVAIKFGTDRSWDDIRASPITDDSDLFTDMAPCGHSQHYAFVISVVCVYLRALVC